MSWSGHKKGPNARTIADGYSFSDERNAVLGPDIDFNYDDSRGENDPHLPNPDEPKFKQSHEGEHRGDFGGSRPEKRITLKVYLWTACAALNSCNLGYDIGVNTVAGPRLQAYMSLTDLELGMFYGSINLFAMVGSLSVFYFSERYGRIKTFIGAAVLFIIGSIIQSTAANYPTLMVGRVFVGLGVGVGLALDPMYIAEITPASHRGEMVTWSEIALNIGITLGFCAGLVFGSLDDSVSWRLMFGVGTMMPTIMILLSHFVMAESPRWLISIGEEEKGRMTLQSIYGGGYDISPIVLDIREALEREYIAGKAMGWDAVLFPSPAYRRMLLVGIGTAVAQQAVGIEAVQYYLEVILMQAGLEERSTKLSIILIGLGILKLLFIIVGGKLFDRKGRRPVLFISLCGVAGALFMLSINFFGKTSDGSSTLAIFSLAVYLSFFSLGMGPGGWLIPSEIFTMSIRAKAISLSTFFNRLTAAIMSTTFLPIASTMTLSGFFFLLTFITFIVLAFFYYLLPETKGRSLEDMSMYFAEITRDRSILDAESRIVREREAVEHAQRTAPRFELPRTRDLPREQLPDATISGTMA